MLRSTLASAISRFHWGQGGWRFAAALILFWSLASVGHSASSVPDRYFVSGDGRIDLKNGKTGRAERVQYRLADGSYPAEARRRIDRLFGIPDASSDQISLRLVSLLDFIEDRYRQPIEINSGYRSPEYNADLRAKGRLAARASLHIEGMAADIVLGRRLAPAAFEDLKAMDCCGVGYYHGASLHVDTGPARFWDETSSKVDTDISARNKRIMVVTDRDIYLPGEVVTLRLARITDYPFSVSADLSVLRHGEFVGTFPMDSSRPCLPVSGPEDRTYAWALPREIRHEERLQVRLSFCDKPFPEMPDHVDSNPFVIRSAR